MIWFALPNCLCLYVCVCVCARSTMLQVCALSAAHWDSVIRALLWIFFLLLFSENKFNFSKWCKIQPKILEKNEIAIA